MFHAAIGREGCPIEELALPAESAVSHCRALSGGHVRESVVCCLSDKLDPSQLFCSAFRRETGKIKTCSSRRYNRVRTPCVRPVLHIDRFR